MPIPFEAAGRAQGTYGLVHHSKQPLAASAIENHLLAKL